jgi:Protein of unknown function (DUF2975)
MSQAVIVDFAIEEPEAPVALRRMRWVSRGLEILFLVLAVGFGLIASAALLDFIVPYAGDALTLGPSGGFLTLGPHHPLPASYISPGAMPVVQRLAHVPVGLLHVVPTFILFWSLQRLFGLYARGIVFAPENARHIKHIGAALAVSAVAPFLGFTFLNSLSLAIDHSWMHGTSLQELVLGAVVYVIAQVMQLGHQIEEERSQFV